MLKCIVLPLLEACPKEELCSPDGSLHGIFLKMITRCKCPEHLTENPVELPNIDELNGSLVMVLDELLNWGIDHLPEDTSGNSRALVKFISENCLSDKASSLLTIIGNLQQQYSGKQ